MADDVDSDDLSDSDEALTDDAESDEDEDAEPADAAFLQAPRKLRGFDKMGWSKKVMLTVSSERF